MYFGYFLVIFHVIQFGCCSEKLLKREFVGFNDINLTNDVDEIIQQRQENYVILQGYEINNFGILKMINSFNKINLNEGTSTPIVIDNNFEIPNILSNSINPNILSNSINLKTSYNPLIIYFTIENINYIIIIKNENISLFQVQQDKLHQMKFNDIKIPQNCFRCYSFVIKNKIYFVFKYSNKPAILKAFMVKKINNAECQFIKCKFNKKKNEISNDVPQGEWSFFTINNQAYLLSYNYTETNKNSLWIFDEKNKKFTQIAKNSKLLNSKNYHFTDFFMFQGKAYIILYENINNEKLFTKFLKKIFLTAEQAAISNWNFKCGLDILEFDGYYLKEIIKNRKIDISNIVWEMSTLESKDEVIIWGLNENFPQLTMRSYRFDGTNLQEIELFDHAEQIMINILVLHKDPEEIQHNDGQWRVTAIHV